MVILDTTALIDLLRGDAAATKKIQALEHKHTSLSTTSISVFELWQASDVLDHAKRERIRFLLESLSMFSFDVPAAEEAGSIHAALKRQGTMIDPEDSMIAGIAKFHKEPVLTRNIKHFTRISGLDVESY